MTGIAVLRRFLAGDDAATPAMRAAVSRMVFENGPLVTGQPKWRKTLLDYYRLEALEDLARHFPDASGRELHLLLVRYSATRYRLDLGAPTEPSGAPGAMFRYVRACGGQTRSLSTIEHELMKVRLVA